MRKLHFETGEYYHIYNKGVDKRSIFSDSYDFGRFLESMEEFNTPDPVGSLYELSFKERSLSLGGRGAKSGKLVDIIAFCLNPNHFHLILRQKVDGGISKFLLKLGGGYGWYFNNKYTRSGTLFQGRFKAVHVDSNEYLLYLSAYVNLNNRVHGLRGGNKHRSSWEAYIDKRYKYHAFLEKHIILNQFSGIKAYKEFAESCLQTILVNKDKLKELELSVGE